MTYTTVTWETIAAEKRQALRALIPDEWVIPLDILPPESQLDVTSFPKESGWFTGRELEITSTPAPQILVNIATGSWTSEEVTRAFCKAAAAAHQLVLFPPTLFDMRNREFFLFEQELNSIEQTNCLSEILFDKAIVRARQLDEYHRKTGRTKGPFHGLPISIKDNFNIIGHDSTVGFTSLVNDPATYNSTLIDLLLDAGAVLYVKTNVPTAMMIAESVNNLFGRTVNPRNRNLTSGGSSGGESALIAFGASRLGVGTDIGKPPSSSRVRIRSN